MAEYKPPFIHRNAHLATILPNQVRPISSTQSERISIYTADGDFIDVDVINSGSQTAVILLHGLEGSSNSNYILGMSKALNEVGLDVICMNFRGCSGKPNNAYQSYHSGKTDDLAAVITAFETYKNLFLIGFSLGGNVALKYMGEGRVDHRVLGCVGISVPVDLSGSCDELSKLHNTIYLHRFLKQLKKKALEKARRFPESKLDVKAMKSAKNFRNFDDLYTAPAHGFLNAADYYQKSSSKQFLKFIDRPTLIINALNDSFLSPSCYPFKECNENDNLTLLTPHFGGHVGFATDNLMRKQFWHEQKAIEFIGNFTT